MKTLQSILVFSALAAMLLSCSNDDAINDDAILDGLENGALPSDKEGDKQDDKQKTGDQPPVFSCKDGGVSYDYSFIQYDELDQSCKDEQRKLMRIYDLQEPDINWDYVYSHLKGYALGSGEVAESGSYSGGSAAYNVNGIDMNQKEYDDYKKEYWRKYYEELERNKKVLPVLCIVNNNNSSWLALLTDEEISLLKKDGGFIVEDYIEYVDEAMPDAIGGNGGWDGGNRCGGNGVTPENGNVLVFF